MRAPERIAIVTTSYPGARGDAAGHFVKAEADALVAAGHAVTVFAGGGYDVEPGNPTVVRIADGGATGWPGVLPRLRERPLRALGLVRWMRGARRALSRCGPFERVIAHWLVPAGFPVSFDTTPGARLEVVVHGSDARLLARLPRPLARAILICVSDRATALRCVSEELADLVRSLAGSDTELPIRVEPAPISLSGVGDRRRAREELGVSSGARLILVVARLVADKRVAEALEAARLVPDARVVVVGDGPERRTLERRFAGVEFTGLVTRERALSWMAAADVLLSASRLEGAPTVIREARALGVPVVATEAGDLLRWAADDPGLCVVR